MVERIVLSATENDRLRTAFNKAVRWAYREKKTHVTADDLADKNVQPLVYELNDVLRGAIQEGIAYEIPDRMLRHLQENVYVFSGCKTVAELRELGGLLLDDNGKVKPFSKFFAEVRQVHETYNKNYLESEYLFATQSARMAGKWAEIEQDGDDFNLQYRTASDDRVRPEHMLLHDTTLPPSDPFWRTYYPPNGWRCRCTVVQVRKERYPVSDSTEAMAQGAKATYTEGKGGINTSAMFRFNPGLERTIFPSHHPYFRDKRLVENVLGEVARKVRKEEFEQLQRNVSYTDVAINHNGGLKATHQNHIFDPRKGHYERDVQTILFNNGHKIVLESEKGGAIGQRYVDALFDRHKADIKAIEGQGKNTIKRAMQEAKRQGAEAVILYFPDGSRFTMERLGNSIAAYNGQTQHRFEEIIFIVAGKVYKY